MKFICERNLLNNAISVAARTVSPKSTLPVLEGIYLRAGRTLQLTGYNMETGITVEIDADVRDPGECVMPTRLFSEIVRRMPDEEIIVNVDDKFKATIKGSISSFQLMVSSADEYPELPEVKKPQEVALLQGELREMINGTIFAASDNQATPIFTGCLFEIEQQTLTMVCVDNFRLARWSRPLEAAPEQSMRFVVPSAALKELEKLLTEPEEPVRIYPGEKHILFKVDKATLVCRLLDGKFLDWRRVIPENNSIRLTANVAALTASMERVSLIISEKYKVPVRCLLTKDAAELTAVTTVANARDVCPLAGDGKETEIGLNNRYVLDALKAVPAAEVSLELSSWLSPVVLRPCEDKYDFTYMIMPVRLKAE